MDFYRQQFIKNFNIEMVASDLMDLIDEDKLQEYIIEQFNENFTYEELYNLFSQEMNKEDLQSLLEEMGHDFTDLDRQNVKITSSQLKILKDNFGVSYCDKGLTLELEQWTNGGVDMTIYIDLCSQYDLVEQFEYYVDNFDIDDEIDIYRQDEDYRNHFTITESVKDFQEWEEFIKNILKQLKESE